MVRIAQSFIQDLVSRTDLVELVQSRVELKRAGKNYTARCPFHDEKTGSFTVNPDKQFYYCFGCGAHGNAIGFLMAYNRLEFIEAVQELAAHHHLEIPTESNETPTQNLKPFYEILESVAQYYQAQLRNHPEAISYLKSRGLDGHIAKKFGLGYAPKGWDMLTNEFGNNPITQQLLIDSGMLIQKEARHYDRFRDRIIFPIRDARGRMIAFGGRSLGDEQPKYLNSPETPVFHKGLELYGLYEAHQKVSEFKKLLIVEGYMDVIALSQYGINYAVATLGTAIGIKHIQKLLRYTGQLIFCFDGDTAGQNAALKALSISLPLMHDGIQVRFLFLPQSEDPDSLIRKIGLQEFEKQINNSLPLADFLFQHLKKDTPVDTLENKALFAKKAKAYLDTMPQGLYQHLLYEKLAKELQVNLSFLQKEPSENSQVTNNTSITPHQKTALKKPTRNKTVLPPEKLAIAILLQLPELANSISLKELELLHTPELSLLLKLHQLLSHQSDLNIGQILTNFSLPEEQQLLAELASKTLPIPQEGWADELSGAIVRLKEHVEFNVAQELIKKAKTSTLNPTEKETLQKMLINKSRRKLDCIND